MQAILATNIYSRYGHNQDLPKRGEAAKSSETGESNSVRKSRLSKKLRDEALVEAGRQHTLTRLKDMVHRLNTSPGATDNQIVFNLAEHPKHPYINMIHKPTDEVLNRFGAQDLMYLERSLFDHAGFQMDLVA